MRCSPISDRLRSSRMQIDAIDRVTRPDSRLLLDAQALSERLFGDHMPANLIVLGAVWQQGLVPLSSAAIDRALVLNGAGVERNRAAFAWGRACVAAPGAVEAATRPATPPALTPPAWAAELAARTAGDRPELRELLEVRLPELAAFGGKRLAIRYSETVAAARTAEEAHAPGESGFASAVARGLHKLSAYKDEYEVARLHLDTAERARIHAELGGAERTTYHLHPPLLRALGMKRKLRLGGWFTPGLRLLKGGRHLRGTPLDPDAPATHATCVELAELPGVVRGYEDIKLRAVERFRERAAELRSALLDQAEVRPTGQETPVPPSPQ